MELTRVKSIETAINQIDGKKEKLKKALEDLQSHSNSVSSLATITWPDLDSYFTLLHSQLLQNFSLLKTLESSKTPKSTRNASDLVPARPELATLCRDMDGVGLRSYLINRPKDMMNSIRSELADALKHVAPDPGALVLDALEGFCYGKKISSDSRVRTACLLLFEELVRSGVEITPNVKERARSIGSEWLRRISSVVEEGDEISEAGYLERLGYLHFLASYKLFTDDAREVNQLVDFVVAVSKYRQAVYLCRNLCLDNRVPDVIQRLIMNGKQLVALKFIFEFGLSDQFPPVPLLKAYLAGSKKIAENVRKSGKNSRQALNEAGVKEINALKSVIKCVKENGLESQHPVHDLLARIEKLEKEQSDRKRSGPASIPKPQQKLNQPKQNGKKRMRSAGGPSADKRKVPANSLPPSQSSFANRAGLLTEHTSPYLSRPTGPYAGSSLIAAAPYGGQSVDLYGLQGAHMGYSTNQNPAASNPYSSATHTQPVHYDSTVGYGGYDVAAQYHHPVYYPQ